MATDFPGVRVRSDKGALLRDWAGSRAHVFLDFGDEQTLWWLSPNADETCAYIVRISRAEFIATHRRTATQDFGDFDSFGEALIGLVSDYESYRRAQESKRVRRNFPRTVMKSPRGRSQRRRRL